MLTDLHPLRHRSNEIAHRANEDKVTKSGFLVVIILAVLSHSSNADRAGFELPRPNGCYGVGVRTDVLRDAQRNRELLGTTWYPADGGPFQPAPYMDKRTADALAEEWKLQPEFQRLVRTRARFQAPILARSLSGRSGRTWFSPCTGHLHCSG